ncbi:MAG TPA: TonB-dependent receptor [Vicinamibacterales bacterium]|jgi:hypothetical protein
MNMKTLIAFCLALAVAAGAAAQGNPTGTIRGQVVDPDKLALPGVTVTVTSPALQGARTAVTSANGDFIIPFLPAGEYTVTVELQGFQAQKQTIGVAMAETQPLMIKMSLASLTETVNVTGTTNTEVLTTSTVAETYKKDTLERLPIGRTLNDATLLAPGVAPNGPSGNIMMSGALSFENLFLVNGVVVNENLRGQALNLFIEDAIQETKVSTGSISAEYGRFQGGVVNMITKSGGNNFSGSFRTTFDNDAWRSLTPDPNDQKVDTVTPTYELTAGGPIRKDKVWFFGAYRLTDPKRNKTLDYTGVNFTYDTKDTRYEAKVTYALNQKNNIKASYTKRTTASKNNWFGSVMDLASLYDNSTEQTLTTVNYTNVLTSNIFLEGQYSRKISATMDTGSRFSDPIKGTYITDRSRNSYRYNAPTFCAVCYDSTGTGWLEHRDNWDWFVKMSYFVSTKKTGSHNLVFGFDNYKEWRKNNNWQSGSSFAVNGTSAIINGTSIFPVLKNDNTTYINWMPLVKETVGNDIRTYSGYINDAWRLSNKLSFNIGARYDMNRSKDQSGAEVVKDSQWSPRVGFSWDIKGDAKWIANAAFSRYVMGISTALVDAGSAGGRTASYSWYYKGPNINTAAAGPYLTADQALPILWKWFNDNGGVNMKTRTAPSIPGVSTRVKDGVVSPSSNEFSFGIANQLGDKGVWRVDYVYRKSGDMYGDYLDMSTGLVADPTGRQFNLTLTGNTPLAKRTYQSVVTNFNYRFKSVIVSANYTLSKMWGNVNGENTGSGPIRADLNWYPEYKQEGWNYPLGYNPGDQRHKFRGMVTYRVPVPQSVGSLDIGMVQRYDSPVAQDIAGTVDSRSYVNNPGYLNPTSGVTYYFIGRGDYRFDPVWTTDLSVMWGKKIPGIHTEVFFRGVITNLFNNAAVTGGDTTVNTNYNNKAYAVFNPFTSAPVQGTNWDYSSIFGRPQSKDDYQRARLFTFSVGVRF